jgi:hypothetical protein
LEVAAAFGHRVISISKSLFLAIIVPTMVSMSINFGGIEIAEIFIFEHN